MEGRKPNGVIVVTYRCAQPAKSQELAAWCDSTLIPVLNATGVFSALSRWDNGNPDAVPTDSHAVIVLETQGDAAAAKQRFLQVQRDLQRQGKLSPLLADVQATAYKRTMEPVTKESAARSAARKNPIVSWEEFKRSTYAATKR